MTPPSCKTSSSRAAFICTIFILLTSITSTFGYCFKSILSFGNSFADTGNSLHFSKDPPVSGFPPYGDTYFHKPTGRFSDGRLVIDFFACHFGLPFIPPYFGPDNVTMDDFGEGVNYAFGGATALNSSYLEKIGVYNPFNNISLSVELGWFKKMLANICPDTSSDHVDNCEDVLQKSLFLLGEIGGNDALYAVFQGKYLEVPFLLAEVINTIGRAVKELIQLGVVNIMVPGQIPFGCVPAVLAAGDSLNILQVYDPSTGCITFLNKAAELYNGVLKAKLEDIRKDYPHANIIYADYYKAAMQMYNSPEKYGITNTLDACCGGGGQHNINRSAPCGSPDATVCSDPSSYVSWDGVHMTDKAYNVIANGLLEDLDTTCPSVPKNGLADS